MVFRLRVLRPQTSPVYRILALCLIVFGFAQSSVAGEKIKIALNWKPEPEFGGFYSALATGQFLKRGVEAEIVPGGSGTPVVQMIASGEVEFGLVSADEILLSRSNGSDIVALFAVYQTNPQGIMVHASSSAQNISSVFSSPGLLALQRGLPYADYLIKKYPSAKVKIVPYQGGIANFLADPKYSQQCFVTSEPLDAKKNGVEVRTFLVADEGYNPYTTVLATRARFLKKNAKIVKAVVEATREGWIQYVDRPDSTNQIMFGLNKSMDLATFAAAAEAQKKLIIPAAGKNSIGVMSNTRWQQLIDQLLDLKVIAKSLEPSEVFEK